MVDKCSTCMLRYHCDEMTDWECKHNRYRHYTPDTSKIAELKGTPETEVKKYLAVYWYVTRKGKGLGNVEVGVKTKLSSECVREVERSVANAHGYEQVILLNLVPLEG